MRRDVYQEITNRVIAQLETVQPGDFAMPWVSTGAGMPQSIANRAYRGINVPLLMIEASERGFSSNIWGTYKAWQAADAQVRKGEKGTRVVFWKRTTYTETGDDGEDTERQSLFAKMYTVFAGEQVDGYKPGTVELPCKAAILDTVETLTTDYLTGETITFAHGGNRAFYAPSRDHIQLPDRDAFRDTEGYYATLLHEIGHSTGSPKRLDREFGKRFGNDAYAFEELVAEFASAMMCGTLGVTDTPRPDHAAYISSWLSVLKNDKRAIFTAASKAQAAADLVLAYEADDLREAA